MRPPGGETTVLAPVQGGSGAATGGRRCPGNPGVTTLAARPVQKGGFGLKAGRRRLQCRDRRKEDPASRPAGRESLASQPAGRESPVSRPAGGGYSIVVVAPTEGDSVITPTKRLRSNSSEEENLVVVLLRRNHHAVPTKANFATVLPDNDLIVVVPAGGDFLLRPVKGDSIVAPAQAGIIVTLEEDRAIVSERATTTTTRTHRTARATARPVRCRWPRLGLASLWPQPHGPSHNHLCCRLQGKEGLPR